MSYDTPEENATFRDDESFPFRLLSDVDREVGPAYEAYRDPEQPRGGLPNRITYLIDPEGVIVETYQVTDVATHPDEVLADLRRHVEQADG